MVIADETRLRLLIWAKASLVIIANLLSVYLVYSCFTSRLEGSRALAVVLAGVIVQSGTIITLVAFLFCSRWVLQRREERFLQIASTIRQELSLHAGGSDRSQELRNLLQKFPREVARCLVEMLSQTRGTGHERMGKFALEYGLVAFWERKYCSWSADVRKAAIQSLALIGREETSGVLSRALEDHEASIRVDAARALVSLGHPSQVELIFQTFTHQSLRVRCLLAEELRPHALMLIARAIPEQLASGDKRTVLTMLELLHTWQLGLALPAFDVVLRNPDPDLRSSALRLLPYVRPLTDPQPFVLEALDNPAPKVRAAAAYSAGRLRLNEALPLLKERLNDSHLEVSLTSAYSLSELGEAGLAILEEAVLAGANPAATVAIEALEGARIGYHEYTRI